MSDFFKRYNGRATSPPQVFPPEMEEACCIIEDVVNKVVQHRRRYPLEWGGSPHEGRAWKANVAASNCYAGMISRNYFWAISHCIIPYQEGKKA